MAMASRRLAMSLNQGLRAKKAISAVKPKMGMGLTRSLATPVKSNTTQSTTLSNGFTVRSHWICPPRRPLASLTSPATDRNRALSLRPDQHRGCLD